MPESTRWLAPLLAFSTTVWPLTAQQPPAGGRGMMPAPMSVNVDDHTGFVQIFDGKSTAGWEGAPEVWTVVDGAIVADNSPDKPVGGTTFIWFADAGIADFELKLEMKVEGGGNSGIQYRSRNVEEYRSAVMTTTPSPVSPSAPPSPDESCR